MKIGFIGIGVMGLPMAKNLVKKSGCEILGLDVFEERRALFAEAGGTPVTSIEKILQNCDVIFLCLPTNILVEQHIQSVIDQGKKGTILVDLSSTAPAVIRQMYEPAQKAEIKLLDSPVSGGEAGAIGGTLVFMCGGDREVFEVVQPLLLCMGSKATYMGGTGCGSVAKLANNMIVGCNIAAVAESFAFAVKAGLNPTVLFEAIKDGFAGSAVMEAKVPKIIRRDFSASARVAVHQKDLINAVHLAEEMEVEIPISKMVLEMMNELEQDGKIDEDHCALAEIYEKRMEIKIK